MDLSRGLLVRSIDAVDCLLDAHRSGTEKCTNREHKEAAEHQERKDHTAQPQEYAELKAKKISQIQPEVSGGFLNDVQRRNSTLSQQRTFLL